jgi:hypothetical protein
VALFAVAVTQNHLELRGLIVEPRVAALRLDRNRQTLLLRSLGDGQRCRHGRDHEECLSEDRSKTGY